MHSIFILSSSKDIFAILTSRVFILKSLYCMYPFSPNLKGVLLLISDKKQYLSNVLSNIFVSLAINSCPIIPIYSLILFIV